MGRRRGPGFGEALSGLAGGVGGCPPGRFDGHGGRHRPDPNFRPLPHVAAYPEINRKVTDEEYEEIVDYARFLGMSQVYIQEGGCVGESFIPAFDYEGIERNV